MTDSHWTFGTGAPAPAGGNGLSGRLAKIDTAIYRRKRIEFEYHSMQRDETSARKVDPYHLLCEGGQFYLVGYSHERRDVRVFRLSRIRGKGAPFPFPADIPDVALAGRIGPYRKWSLEDGVGETLELFGALVAAGKLGPADVR